MKSPYVGELVPNEVITAHLLVLSKEIRQKKTGEPYLSLILSDKTGELEAKMWDNVSEVMDTFDRDDFVKVKGLVQVYQKRSQFTIHKLRRMMDDEVDLADFFPCSDRNADEMWSELQATIAAISNPHLRRLLERIFADPNIAAKYRMAPAAKSIHHACRGGLLQHVLSMCALARLIAAHYSGLDLDLVMTGTILHDIGKIEELTYARSFGYSSEGQLLGHIVIGIRMIGDQIRSMPDFPPKLRTLLEHLIISHHGELEFGSPKVPAFPEALLLHHLDNLDSKMEAMRAVTAREKNNEGEFTGWIPSLERMVLHKDRYLTGPLPNAAGQLSLPVAVPELVTATATIEASTPAEPEPVPTPSSLPAPPVDRPPASPQRPPQKPPANTLFGEKLQAVLSGDK